MTMCVYVQIHTCIHRYTDRQKQRPPSSNEHTECPYLGFNIVLHSNEPGLTKEMTDTKAEAGKMQHEKRNLKYLIVPESKEMSSEFFDGIMSKGHMSKGAPSRTLEGAPTGQIWDSSSIKIHDKNGL